MGTYCLMLSLLLNLVLGICLIGMNKRMQRLERNLAILSDSSKRNHKKKDGGKKRYRMPKFPKGQAVGQLHFQFPEEPPESARRR